MAVLEREDEKLAVVMLQFLGGRLRIRGRYVALLRREAEETAVVMWQFWGGV